MKYRYNFNANGTRYQHDIIRTNKRVAIKEAIESARDNSYYGDTATWIVYVEDNTIKGYKPIAYGMIDAKGRNHYLPLDMAY